MTATLERIPSLPRDTPLLEAAPDHRREATPIVGPLPGFGGLHGAATQYTELIGMIDTPMHLSLQRLFTSRFDNPAVAAGGNDVSRPSARRGDDGHTAGHCLGDHLSESVT